MKTDNSNIAEYNYQKEDVVIISNPVLAKSLVIETLKRINPKFPGSKFEKYLQKRSKDLNKEFIVLKSEFIQRTIKYSDKVLVPLDVIFDCLLEENNLNKKEQLELDKRVATALHGTVY